MLQYGIANDGYPGPCADPLTVPVTAETGHGLGLSAELAEALKPGHPFEFCLEDAIQCAERSMVPFGQRPNTGADAVRVVEEWLNLQRWQIRNLWTVDAAAGALARNEELGLPHEQYRRSAEILAEGVALLLLETRLHIPRKRFFFAPGGGPRPDFLGALKRHHRRGLAWKGKYLALEVRARKSQARIYASEADGLWNKKERFALARKCAGMVSVYCFYGDGAHRNGDRRTRVHLADPEVPGEKLTDLDLLEIELMHYAGVMSRAGLPEYRVFIQRVLRYFPDYRRARGRRVGVGDFAVWIREDRATEADSVNTRGRPLVRGVAGREFVGAAYCPLIALLAAREAPELLDQARAGRLGAVVFRGVRREVLNLIEGHRWNELLEDRSERQRSRDWNRVLRSDGSWRETFECADRGSNEARWLFGHAPPNLRDRLRG